MRAARLWLCVPPFLLCMLDQTITLVGQTPTYWNGDYGAAAEGNPWFYWLLRQHPLAFEAGIAAWAAVFVLFILIMPRRVAMTVSIAIVLGHTWGTATWLYCKFPHGYWLAIALFLASAITIVVTWERAWTRLSATQRV